MDFSRNELIPATTGCITPRALTRLTVSWRRMAAYAASGRTTASEVVDI